MIARWRTMPRGDRLRVQALIAFGLVAVYAPFCLQSSNRLFEAEKMLHRRRDRIEKRAQVGDLGGGPNLRTVQNRLAQVEAELAEEARRHGELDARFVPVDSVEAQQQLLLEISTLAERTGFRLVSITRKGTVPEGRAAGALPVDRTLGRPLLEIEARARFLALYEFLGGLAGLSHHAAATNLKLSVRDPKAERGREAEASSGQLYVQLQLSL